MVYKVCVIGCGNIGSNWSTLFSKWPVTHLAAYSECKNTEVVAVCDVNLEKAKDTAAKWGIEKYYQDVDEMLALHNPDFVSVCTPCEDHYETVKKIVRYPVKAIFCEKPIADNINRSREMITLCNEKGIVLLINHVRRFDPLHQYVRENLTNLIGDPQKVLFFYSGGILNQGSHLFDLLRFYFGDVEWVQAEGKGKDLDVMLKFKSGLVASILSFNFKDISIFNIAFVGDKARLELINKPFWDYDYQLFIKEESETMKGVNTFSSQSSFLFPKKMERTFFRDAINEMIRCVELNQKPISSGEDGLSALNLIIASIYSSENEGKRVYIPFESNLNLPTVEGELIKWQKN